MKKILLMPDSFKGTMTSKKVASIMEKAIKDVDASYQVRRIPISDGGEGFLDFYEDLHPDAEKKLAKVNNESMQKKVIKYLVDNDNIIIESAKIFGLPDATGEVMKRSSYGLGELINKVHQKYPKKEIIISVGGTSTIDMGLGLLEALGAKFYNHKEERIFPLPKNVKKIKSFDFTSLKLIDQITILSDVKNPLFGELGGIAVYSSQKGASLDQIKELNQDYQKLIKVSDDKEYYGAGGGLVASFAHFLNADISSGMDYVLDKINFDEILADTSYIWTGEGSIDSQSFDGKVVGMLYNRAIKKNIPVISFAGRIEQNTPRKKGLLFIPIHSNQLSYEHYKENSKENLYRTCYQIMKLLTY